MAVLGYDDWKERQLEASPEVYGLEFGVLSSPKLIAPILPDQREAIALNAYMESRGDGKVGMIATTNTVHHRLKDAEFPKTYHEVIYQPKQFSWTLQKIAPQIDDEDSYHVALQIADLELNGKLPDLVNGARFYANPRKVNIERHKWVATYQPLAEVGDHLYMDKADYIKANKLKPLPKYKISKIVQNKLYASKKKQNNLKMVSL